LDATAIEGQEYEFSDKVEPGLIEDLPPGWDMSFADPPQPTDDKDFQLSILRAVAADYGIPYEVMTGDLSEVNFSSARMGWNEFARNISAWRWQMLEPQLFSNIARWYLEAERVAGYDTTGARVMWTAPSRTMVDKTREIKPLIEEIRASLISLPEAIRQVGYDPLTLAQEQAQFVEVLNGLGLKVDSIPAHDIKRETETQGQTDAE
jgi:capsid protein